MVKLELPEMSYDWTITAKKVTRDFCVWVVVPFVVAFLGNLSPQVGVICAASLRTAYDVLKNYYEVDMP